MSRRQISRSPDLQRIESEGYTVSIAGGKLVVRDVPFVDTEGAVRRDGVLVMPLTLAGDVARPPDTHTASFCGGIPHDRHGNELTSIINGRGRTDLGDDLIAECTFSMKPLENDGKYRNFHEKVTKYVAAISGHAAAVDSHAKATIFKPVVPDDDGGPFYYVDTASSRAGIDALNEKLKAERIAIIGLGGTGEYVLDFVAKTHVREIHVFDDDHLLTHNAFRAPGALTLEELTEAPLKVNHFSGLYGGMRKGIIAHPYRVAKGNAEELREMTFVFIGIDDALAKEPIVAALLELGIPFIDVGMGVNEVNGLLTGIVRTTIATPAKHDHVPKHVKYSDAGFEADYRSNIQIAELNARNASDAVIRWKRYRGIYADLSHEHSSAFTIATNHVVNEEVLIDDSEDRSS